MYSKINIDASLIIDFLYKETFIRQNKRVKFYSLGKDFQRKTQKNNFKCTSKL